MKQSLRHFSVPFKASLGKTKKLLQNFLHHIQTQKLRSFNSMCGLVKLEKIEPF